MKRLPLKYLAHVAFGAAAVLIVLLGGVLYQAKVRSRASASWVTHSLVVIQAIDNINEEMSRAESAQRSYLLTGREAFVVEREQALAQLSGLILSIKASTADNPEQQQRIVQLEALLAERIGVMQVNGTRFKNQGSAVAMAIVVEGVGQKSEVRVYELTSLLKHEEMRLLGLRRAGAVHRYESTLILFMVAVLIGLVVLGYGGFVAQARARAEAERKLADMTESLPGAVYQSRSVRGKVASRRFEIVSRSVTDLFGIDREALLRDANLFWDCVLPEDQPALAAALESASRTLEPLRHEFRIGHSKGRLRWMRSTSSVRQEPDGSLLWNGFWVDITEQKALESALQEAKEVAEAVKTESRYRGLLEAAPDAMVVVNQAGDIVLLNVQAEKQFGYRRDELLGQPVTNLIPEGFAERIIADGTRTAAEALAQQIGTGIELSGRRRDGVMFPIEIMLSPLVNAEGTLVTAAIRDISARKDGERQKEAAESSNRAKSVFLATMSHEIRTPMNGVLGMLELLSLTKLDSAQLSMLNVVRESGRSLQRIIDDILDFSKIEAGKLEVCPEPASITAAVETVRNIYSGLASAKSVLFSYTVDPDISPALLVDPMRLRQILNNLVSNALKFTSKGSVDMKVELVRRAHGVDRVRFTVTDTGIGISITNQARLFQPFVQASADTSPRFGGTGLGLTICQRLAKMMNGSIEMVSEIGKGTTMILELSLPIADQKDIPLPEQVLAGDTTGTTPKLRRPPPTLAEAEAEGTLVLLADDHPTNRSLLASQVNMLGYAVETVADGHQALEQWKTGRFGLLITDCNMPEMNGYELTHSIRQREATGEGGRIPIIACTANALRGEAENCLAMGMDDYLAKPIELRGLAGKLDRWLPLGPKAATMDGTVLDEITFGNMEAQLVILADFRKVNDEDAVRLSAAVGSGDLPKVTYTTHRIQGASSMVGAAALAEVCNQIEHASRANDWPAIKAAMGPFHRELMRLNAHCEGMICPSPN